MSEFEKQQHDNINDSNAKIENKKKNIKRELLEWAATILVALLISLLIRGFLIEHTVVEGPSMEDTLLSGQHLIVYKLGYFFSPPEREDIIVLKRGGLFNNIILPDPKGVDYIKRIIAVPGDTLDIKAGSVYLNGKKLNETFVKGETFGQGMEYPMKIPPKKVFVMGDNRDVSYDSRYPEVGLIDYSKIKGKAVLRVFPFKKIGILH